MLTREHIGIALMVIAVTGLICTIAWWLLATEDTDTGTFWQRVWFYMTADDSAFHLEASGRHAAARHVAPAGAGLGNPPARGHTHLPEPANPSATRGPGQADDLTQPDETDVINWLHDELHDDTELPLGGTLREGMSGQPLLQEPAGGASPLDALPVPPLADGKTRAEERQPGLIRTAKVGGVHLPLTDDTVIDLKPEPRAGRPPWQPATPPPAWHWNGHTWLRQAPTGLAWLDALCTQPLQPALEAAA